MDERVDRLMTKLAAKKAELADLDGSPGITGFLPKCDSADEETKELREALSVDIANLERELNEATRTSH